MVASVVGSIVLTIGKMIIFGATALASVLVPLALMIGKVIIFGIAMLISFIKPLAIAVGAVIAFGISLLSVAIPALLAVTGAVFAFTAALLTNPIVLIGMAIAAVAYLIYDNFDMPDNIDFDQDMSSVAVADAFGGPPKEILDQMKEEEKLGIMDNPIE